MSLYIKEKPENLVECLESILCQTVMPDEIVIVKDGPLTDELEKTLADYAAKNPELYTFVPLEKNVGLGLALAEGMLHCKNELVARMDTDDISRKDRFEKQLAEFEKTPSSIFAAATFSNLRKTPKISLRKERFRSTTRA